MLQASGGSKQKNLLQKLLKWALRLLFKLVKRHYRQKLKRCALPGVTVLEIGPTDANYASENPNLLSPPPLPQGLCLHRTVSEATVLSWGNHISPDFLDKPKGRDSGACREHSAGGRGWGALQTGPLLPPAGRNWSRYFTQAGHRNAKRSRSAVRTLNPVRSRQAASLCLSKKKILQTFAVVNLLKVN